MNQINTVKITTLKIIFVSALLMFSLSSIAKNFNCVGTKYPISDFYSATVAMPNLCGITSVPIKANEKLNSNWHWEDHDGGYDLLATIGSHGCQKLIDHHWAAAGFVKVWWNEGLGWEEPCNINLPLQRTFRALELIQSSEPSMTTWVTQNAYSYFTNVIDGLKFTCEDSDLEGEYVGGGNMWLYPNSMQANVIELAGTLVHEARHDYAWHQLFLSCPWGIFVCDSSFGNNGAWAWELLFYWDYGLNSNKENSTVYLRQSALNWARVDQEYAFVERPNLNIPVLATW